MIISRIIILLTIVAGSVGSAIAKENEPFLPVKNKNKNAETTSTSVGLVTTKEKESFLPVKNAETETKSGHRRTSTTIGEATKAGKAPSGKYPYSDEGVHRQRQHECHSMASFEEGHWIYQNGCNGSPREVFITCQKKGRKEDHDSGLRCTYFEKEEDEDSDVCAYSGTFQSKDVLNTDGEGNCELGPFTIHPVATAGNEGCLQNYPKLDVKIISVDKDKDELQIYFSNDGGESYYNQDDPRLALRIHDDDADGNGMNSIGGSSKGGKGKNKNGRRLVEVTKAQLQRKLQCERPCNEERDGSGCKEGNKCKPYVFCDTFNLACWTDHGICGSNDLYCHCPPEEGYPDGHCQCHTVTKNEGGPCGGNTICDPDNHSLYCTNGQCIFPKEGDGCKTVLVAGGPDHADAKKDGNEDGFDHWTCGSKDLYCHCPPEEGYPDGRCKCHTVTRYKDGPCGGNKICNGGWKRGNMESDLFCCEGKCKHPKCTFLFRCDYSCPP